jgi:hypothetical protein
VVKVDGVMVDFFEGLRLVGDLEAFTELSHVEDIVVSDIFGGSSSL